MTPAPMHSAPRDGTPVVITTRDGERVEAGWGAESWYELPDGIKEHGCWVTDDGWVTPDEAMGWEPNLARAMGIAG